MKKLIGKILSILLKKVGYEIIKKDHSCVKNNIFNTHFSKNVLVSFIEFENATLSHTNKIESKIICQTINKLGFNVDLIDFQEKLVGNEHNKYNLVIGFGNPINQIITNSNRLKTKIIIYMNGANPSYSDAINLKLLTEHNKKSKINLIKSTRFVNVPYIVPVNFSDYLISLGNQFVADTYPNHYIKKHQLPAFYFPINLDLKEKKFVTSQTHFLWLGGTGLLHKGLDYVLDFFSKRTDLTLHICAPTKIEDGFMELYKTIFLKCSNIINYGFISIDSSEFENIIKSCTFSLMASHSEGGAVSTITTMGNGGLIPIISESTGLDVEPFGFTFKDNTYQSMSDKINEALLSTPSENQLKAEKIIKYCKIHYSRKNYNDNLTAIFQDILKDIKSQKND